MLFENDGCFVAGLTGMSGAGKSFACGVFAEKGFSVIDCDNVSREVTARGEPALDEISRCFGAEYINDDGTLDRRKLGALVFSDAKKLKKLEDILYPYITYSIISACVGHDMVLLDAPTLFESGADFLCDVIIGVTADRELCIGRITERDGIDRVQAENRLSSQHGEDYYKSRSYICLSNNGSESEFRKSLEKAAAKILEAKENGTFI